MCIRDTYKKGENAEFTIVYKRLPAQHSGWPGIDVTFTFVIYDELGVPICQTLVNLLVDPEGEEKTFGVSLLIPTWAYVGEAKAYANTHTEIAEEGGVPYCPEAAYTFRIGKAT